MFQEYIIITGVSYDETVGKLLASNTYMGSIGISTDFWGCSSPLGERPLLPMESACEWYLVFPLRDDARSLNSRELILRPDFESDVAEPVSLLDFDGFWDFLVD